MKDELKFIGKNMLKKVIKILLIVAIPLLILHLISIPPIKNIQRYDNYKCYDYNLKCTDLRGWSEYRDIPGESNIKRTYYKIGRESKKQFIGGQNIAWFSVEPIRVLQNPDSYVDVFNDWTVEKMEFVSRNNNVYDTLTDESIIEEFKGFVNSDKTEQELTSPYRYINENIPGQSKLIRIYYEESHNIFWAAEVVRYSSDEYGELIYIELQEGEDGDDVIMASVENYPEIYNWLSDCFANIDSQ